MVWSEPSIDLIAVISTWSPGSTQTLCVHAERKKIYVLRHDLSSYFFTQLGMFYASECLKLRWFSVKFF